MIVNPANMVEQEVFRRAATVEVLDNLYRRESSHLGGVRLAGLARPIGSERFSRQWIPGRVPVAVHLNTKQEGSMANVTERELRPQSGPLPYRCETCDRPREWKAVPNRCDTEQAAMEFLRSPALHKVKIEGEWFTREQIADRLDEWSRLR